MNNPTLNQQLDISEETRQNDDKVSDKNEAITQDDDYQQRYQSFMKLGLLNKQAFEQ